MKAKVIKSILAAKFQEFVATITDDTVKRLIKKESIITGGSIASLLLNEKVNDYDIYFTNHDTALAVAMYYAEKHKAATGLDITAKTDDGRVTVTGQLTKQFAGDLAAEKMDADDPESSPAATVGKPDYHPLYLSANAITLSDGIQIVLRFYGQPEEIHKNYDFVHCTNYWLSGDGRLALNAPALESLITKELRYVGSKYPLCSIIRTRKFIKRGWTINAGQILKMALQLNELNLFDISVLQDQLVGVDSAYFMELLSRIEEGSPEKINSAYVCEIIDRIF